MLQVVYTLPEGGTRIAVSIVGQSGPAQAYIVIIDGENYEVLRRIQEEPTNHRFEVTG
jgi:hypothetical protein